MTKIFHDFPAYDVVEGDVRNGVLHLNAGDRLALVASPTKHFQIGSVVSYAMRNGDCPIAALERAKANGHELHFIFGLGSCIHNGPVTKGRFIGVGIGDEVRFEGRRFSVAAAPNANLKLVPLEGM